MATPPQPLYEARHIDKNYGSVVALSNVSIALYPGEVLGLVGDNGAGRSTLVKVLSGVHNPDAGELLLDGEERHWKSPREAIEAGVETLYQDSGLAPDPTIGANVFPGRERPKPGLLGKLGFLAQKDLAQKEMGHEALADLARVGITVPPSKRTVCSCPEAGVRPSRSGGPSPGPARSSCSTSRPAISAPARPSRCSRSSGPRRRRDSASIFISHTLPHVLEVTDRVVVLRLGKVVRDAPTSEFDAESLLGTITGLIEKV